ncbi:MAG: glycosyltransferase family 39 protein [Elusimicrobia bacterium]|nr:glycosyltransferase family 39 protein [Elusimicrobiota bacterium]
MPRKTAVALAALVFAAILLHSAFQHLIYVDEFWYMEAAKNLILHGRAAGFSKAIGWPGLIAPVFAVFGFDNFAAIALSLLFSALSIPLIFFLARRLLRDDWAAMLACVLWALLPQRVVWASSAETISASVFFILLGLVLSLRSAENQPDRPLLWLAMLCWGMASQVRPENFMFVLAFAAAMHMFSGVSFRSWRAGFLKACGAAALLNLADWLIFARFQSSTDWLARESSGVLGGGNFSLQNLWHNTFHWGPQLLGWAMHPAFLSLAAAAGLWLLWRRSRAEAIFALLCCALLYLFYFSSWLASYGSTLAAFPKTKLFLLFYPFICSLAAYAVSSARVWNAEPSFKLWRIALALFLCASFVPYYRKYPLNSQRHVHETLLLRGLKDLVPQNCVVVANSAIVVNSVNFFTVVEADVFIRDAEVRKAVLGGGCAVFVEDITCSFGFEGLAGNCAAMKRYESPDGRVSLGLSDDSFNIYRLRP